MRTAPVALAYLDDPDGLTEAAMALSALTHYDPAAGEACVLWCQAIRHAVRTGDLDVRASLEHLPASSRGTWERRLDDAERARPGDFTRNGWVVEVPHPDEPGLPLADPADAFRDALDRFARFAP
jgi:ADP-ribosylglycohydrolase